MDRSISKEERAELREEVKDAELHGLPEPHISNDTLWRLLSDLDAADERIAELQQENRRVIEGAAREGNDVEAELAPALGYEYDEGYGWVTGEHTSVTLAMEARRKIGELQQTLENVSEVYLEITNGNISKPGTNPTVVLDYARESNAEDHAEDLRMKDERIAELQTENERLQRVIKNRDNRIRNKMNQLKEVHNRRIAPYTDQIREQGQYIEGLKVAREQDGERIREQEQEITRLQQLATDLKTGSASREDV